MSEETRDMIVDAMCMVVCTVVVILVTVWAICGLDRAYGDRKSCTEICTQTPA